MSGRRAVDRRGTTRRSAGSRSPRPPTRSWSPGSVARRPRTGTPRTGPPRRTSSAPRAPPSRPAAAHAIACSIVAGSPIASNTKSGPPSPAACRIPSTTAPGSAGSAWTQWVAPSEPARSSFGRLTSTATIRRAPASTAPITHDSPTPPEPDHGDRRARRHLGRLDHGADARRHAAPDQRRDLGRDAVGHRHDRRRGHDLRRRHRPDREVGEHRRPVRPREARGAVGLRVAQRRRSGAQPLAAALALAAAQARGVPGQRDRPADDSRRRGPRRPPRSRRRPRARARSGPAAPSRRRGRGGRSGRRPRRSSGRAPRPAAGRRAAASRRRSARPRAR